MKKIIRTITNKKMKRYIVTSKTEKERLERVFKVGARTISNALSFDKDKGYTATAKAIREDALKHGGVIMNGDCVEMETIHFHDGTIVQVFPGERMIEIKGDKAVLTKKGEVVKVLYTPLISELEKLHKELAPYQRDYTKVEIL